MSENFCHRLLGFFCVAAIAAAQQRNFVACPSVRDTKTVPCFLAEYEGELYYLGIQQDIASEFHPPQLKHEVLVEGRIVEGPRVCGGIPLRPLSISVIKEVNLACNILLPAEPESTLLRRPAAPGRQSALRSPVARRDPLYPVRRNLRCSTHSMMTISITPEIN